MQGNMQGHDQVLPGSVAPQAMPQPAQGISQPAQLPQAVPPATREVPEPLQLPQPVPQPVQLPQTVPQPDQQPVPQEGLLPPPQPQSPPSLTSSSSSSSSPSPSATLTRNRPPSPTLSGRPLTPRWLRGLVWGVLWLLGLLLVRPVTFLLHARPGGRKRLPPITDNILTMHAADIARAVRSRKLRVEEVVNAFIARIKTVNPVVNAIVDERFDEALREAQEMDAKLDAGDKSLLELPLLGVPITVKESIAVKGLSFMGGRPVRRGEERCAASDAPSVARMRAAGCVPLCVTNTPESCLWWESYNAYTGYTVNPYDTTLTAGGSSGGEGALLGSGASVLGLGSDVAGSCRLPAFFCGVAGHKPTPAVVPWVGHAPECDDPMWPEYFTQAPMARYVADLPLALAVLAADKAPQLRLDQKVDVEAVRVFYLESEPAGTTSGTVCEEVLTCMSRAVQHLRARGLEVQPLPLAGLALEDAATMSALLMLQLRYVHTIHYDPKRPDSLHLVGSELFRFLTCRSRSTLHAVLAGVVMALARWVPRSVVRSYEKRRATMQARLHDLLGEDGVLLYPSMPEPAHRRGNCWHRLLDSSYLMIFNCLGMPVTQVPLGLGSSGRPVGLQVVANKYQDRLTLSIGKELEEAFGGWVPPPSKE